MSTTNKQLHETTINTINQRNLINKICFKKEWTFGNVLVVMPRQRSRDDVFTSGRKE